MNLQMEIHTKDIFQRVKEKVKVFIHGMIKATIKEIGLKIE